ncbi:hypothetical protein AOQ84DRAFT_402303 [Glonium stellatum]|uniref:Uncharacterized protein n=1 Tax=Glonium stellatum TaxID=574774 RepID=A0A8E2EMK3_9PEZI|nr:hypothetical protein AOQ84DRAFT_402303 [Glonium stellatum]
MSILAALFTQRQKACTVFSDKLAILGNLIGYLYRLYSNEAFQKQLSFSAYALAMALFNGDLSPLFTNDLAFLEYNGEADVPRGLLLSQTHLHTLAGGRSAPSRNRAQVTAGSKCLVLGGKLLVEGILWRIISFTDLKGLEKTTEPIAKEDTRDPIRFYFFQTLVRRLVVLERIDLLELVVAFVMWRQLTSSLELVHLNELQAWSCNEQHWPTKIAEESFLERIPAPREIKYLKYRDARGLDYALEELESNDSQPRDLLSHIHHAILHRRPLALEECNVEDQTLVSLFMFDSSQHQWILTPVNELEYEFGKNPWLHMHPKNTFWCVIKGEQTVSGADSQRASEILNLGADGEKHFLNKTHKVVTSGTRSSITGTWSPRLSRRGVLTIGDDGSWNIISLGQATYFWLMGV